MDDRIRISRNQEKAIAKKIGARQHAGSGSGSRKNDMHTDEVLIECKTVFQGNKQITIKADDLNHLSYNAAIRGISPALHVRLDGKNWIMMPEDDYIELRESQA